MCVHPNQIAQVKAGFMPTAAEVNQAHFVLASPDGGALKVAGAMIDAPVRQRDRQILVRRRRVD